MEHSAAAELDVVDKGMADGSNSKLVEEIGAKALQRRALLRASLVGMANTLPIPSAQHLSAIASAQTAMAPSRRKQPSLPGTGDPSWLDAKAQADGVALNHVRLYH